MKTAYKIRARDFPVSMSLPYSGVVARGRKE